MRRDHVQLVQSGPLVASSSTPPPPSGGPPRFESDPHGRASSARGLLAVVDQIRARKYLDTPSDS